jgi:hypothetical protein
MRRREFVGQGALLPGAAAAARGRVAGAAAPAAGRAELPDLSPARWIWYPSERCLANTFVLFRGELQLSSRPVRARGWIGASSRYLLEVNGSRIQWGPAPCDPRYLEMDPVDLTGALREGANVLGARVLYFGDGDGTWPAGKPGFLFRLEVETAGGGRQVMASGSGWRAHLARSWRPGHYKRWFLRALQEEFDARLFPYGWSEAAFRPDSDWLPAMELEVPAGKPPVCSRYPDYLHDIGANPADTELRVRSIPLLREEPVPALRLAESCWIHWLRPAEEYFECRTPNAFTAERSPAARETGPGVWQVRAEAGRTAALTFEFAEQVAGWPYFSIEAPEGTVVEMLVHEGHAVGGPALLNTHRDSWTRFICRGGRNRFETFDHESGRWLQILVRGASGEVTLSGVGWRRRVFPWPASPGIRCSSAPLQRLIEASLNTLNNCAHDICAGDAARERQQYSGDCGHQIHGIHLALGERRLPARFLATFSQGITREGYFLDAWPGWDRLARLWQRQLKLTGWGPLLDHGLGFFFDCHHHYLYTGALEDLREPYPALLRFARYLEDLVGPGGLLPVENLGVPSVWMDHNAYRRQSHKQCPFNLYAAAALEHGLAPLCDAFADAGAARAARGLGRRLLRKAVARFWSPERALFVNNLPWLASEEGPRYCDRALSTAILYGQTPRGQSGAAARMLEECPAEMGLSYPANAGWRLWALAETGRADAVVKELETRWAAMDSVRLNNTIQEVWKVQPDTNRQWSHCGIVPLYVTYMSLAGIQPLEPGFRRCRIRPQPASLELLELTAHTVRGAIGFGLVGPPGARELTVDLPPGCEAELVVDAAERLPLAPLAAGTARAGSRYALPAGRTVVRLAHT